MYLCIRTHIVSITIAKNIKKVLRKYRSRLFSTIYATFTIFYFYF